MTAEPLSQIVLRAQAGESDAMDQLLRRASRTALPLLRAFCGSGNSVPDLLQEVLWEVWRSLRKLREPERFRPWLVRIAYGKATDHLRKRYRRGGGVEEADLDRRPHPKPEDGLLRTAYLEALEVVREEIENLGPRYSEVVRLRLLAEMGVEAIARVTGKKPGTVKSLLSRGIRLLRLRLGSLR